MTSPSFSFSDPSSYREITQWRAVFNTPSISDTNMQPLFANFGSLSDDFQISRDVDSISQKIAEQFAMDVYMELRNELQTDSRGIQTSHTERKATPKTVPLHRTPNVTPHNSRRGPRNHSILQKEKLYF